MVNGISALTPPPPPENILLKQKIFYPPQFDPKGKQMLSNLDINTIKAEDIIHYIDENWKI